jgi:hypothetical protein
VSPQKRHTCLAYFNVINGTCIALGALAGGWAVAAMPPIGGSVFVTIFALSTVLRVAAALAFRRLVREVRPVPEAALREVAIDLVGPRLADVLGQLAARSAPRRRERRIGRSPGSRHASEPASSS